MKSKEQGKNERRRKNYYNYLQKVIKKKQIGVKWIKEEEKNII